MVWERQGWPGFGEAKSLRSGETDSGEADRSATSQPMRERQSRAGQKRTTEKKTLRELVNRWGCGFEGMMVG